LTLKKRRQVAALQSASREILNLHFWFLNPIRAISVIRGQNSACGGAALGNPWLFRFNASTI
jgi:hypothetical protein